MHAFHAMPPDAWSTAMSVPDRSYMRPGLSCLAGSLLRSTHHGWRGMRRQHRLCGRWAASAGSYGRALLRRHCSGDRADRLHGGLLHRLSDATRLGLRVTSYAMLSGPGSYPGRGDLCVHLRIAAFSVLPRFRWRVLSAGDCGVPRNCGLWPRPAGRRRPGGARHGESGNRLVQRGMQSRVHRFHVQYARASLHAALPSVT